jgi:hypothetical protein
LIFAGALTDINKIDSLQFSHGRHPQIPAHDFTILSRYASGLVGGNKYFPAKKEALGM